MKKQLDTEYPGMCSHCFWKNSLQSIAKDSISCKDCETKYIGETGRSLKTRQKEHQRSVRLAKTKDSALVEHVYDNNHSIDWNNSKIINKESDWFKRKLKEAWMIERIKKSISNRDNGRTLPESYKILFWHHCFKY